MFTHKQRSKAIWDNDIHALQYRREIIVVIIHIYGARDILLLFRFYQDTEHQ